MSSLINKYKNIDLKTEIISGFTSFFAISYIMIVNPMILSDAGIPIELSVFATIFISIIGCLLMFFWADAPIILTPGMGVNAFFTYTLVVGLDFNWKTAISVSIVSSFIYIIIAFTSLSDILAKAIPDTLKLGITVGIGLFLVELGLEKLGLVVAGDNGTLLSMGSITNPTTILGIFGLLLTLVLFIKNIPGNFIIGIGVTTFVAILFQIKGQKTNISINNIMEYPSIFAKFDFSHLLDLKFLLAVFSMTMILVFESMGLLEGILPNKNKFKKSFQVSAVSSLLSGIFGTSPTVAAAESASGIESGGKTGIVALVSAILFAISTFMVGLLSYVPQSAIAPVIIITGALMMQQMRFIKMEDFSEWFPAFLIIALIPLTGSIASGISFGFISYPIVKVANNEAKTVKPIMWALGILFLINLISNTLLV
ncbi:permease [Companilactobacillus sp. RD055328]|uniref:NCS2 family permease n=1 Tax=Companilactobacillus sp. RD055328 TaxID=2916634 RepID=UPI001FC7C89F|nr:NCS2 family permease [Companilactobacillus sp. RD055328]GKQ42383.1 permease [Companilactobacillus sp. RD055328]